MGTFAIVSRFRVQSVRDGENIIITHKDYIWSCLIICEGLHPGIDDDNYCIMSTFVGPFVKLIPNSCIMLMYEWSCETFGKGDN